MIAKITKLIRRHVTTLPAGELTVTLIPPGSDDSGTIEIGIKASKVSERLKLDIVKVWEAHTTPAPVPAEPVEAPKPPTDIKESDEPAFIQRIRTSLMAAVHSDDAKESYRAAANIDRILAEELRKYRGDALPSD